MQDYNFFSRYVYTKKKKSRKNILFPIFLILLIGASAAAYYYLDTEIKELQSESESNESILNSSEYKDVMTRVEGLRLEFATLSMIAEEIPFFEHLLMTDYKVSHSLLDDILNATPKNVAYSSYSVSSEAVSISGISTEYAYIAEFEYNLRALNVFEDIHVSFINGDTNTEDTLGFDIQLLFGGEDYE